MNITANNNLIHKIYKLSPPPLLLEDSHDWFEQGEAHQKPVPTKRECQIRIGTSYILVEK